MDDFPNPLRLVVGAAIVDDLGYPTSVLSARRTEPPALAGRWEHREIREELGVQIELGALVVGPLKGSHAGTWPLGDRYVMQVWLARITVGEPQPLEDHDLLRKLTKAELYDVSWLPADLPIIATVGELMG